MLSNRELPFSLVRRYGTDRNNAFDPSLGSEAESVVATRRQQDKNGRPDHLEINTEKVKS